MNVLLAALASLACAVAPARVLVWSDSPPAEDLHAALRAEGLLPVEGEARAWLESPAEEEATPSPSIVEIEHGYEAAKARFSELDLDGARAHITDVLQLAWRMRAPEEARALLFSILVLQARMHLHENEDARAQAALLLAARIAPGEQTLDPGVHPPSLVEAYARARRSESRERNSALEIEALASGGAATETLVDLQPTAAHERMLGAGPHLVTVRSPARAHSLVVELPRASTLRLPVFLPDPAHASAVRQARAQLSAASDDARRTSALAVLGGESAAQAVLWIRGPARRMWLARSPSALVPLNANADAAMLAHEVHVHLAEPSGEVAPVASGEEGVSPWWFVAGAAGVAAIGGGVALGVWALTQPEPARLVVVSCCVD